MQIRLSSYGQASTLPSPVNRMMSDFVQTFREGYDINLGIGYVNEQTIPSPLIEQALHAVASDPGTYRQTFNYGGSNGSPNLIAAIRRFLHQPAFDRLRIAIGACGATSILDALASILPRGIVVTSDPLYYIYGDSLERKGFEVLAVPEDTEGIDLEILDRKIEEMGLAAARISFFYVVTVNNPSCTILSNARRRALLEVAARLSRQQKRLIPIFYDQAYELLRHDPAIEPFESVLPDDDLGIAHEIGTLSKVLAPALRIGYILGPDSPMMNALVQNTNDVGFSAPLFVQDMAAWILEHHIQPQLEAVNAGYREKALAVRAAIQDRLGPYLEECRGGSAGFYFYLTFREIETHPDSPFFQQLANPESGPKVIYIPGTYCVQPHGDLAEKGKRQLRLSYGFEPIPPILRAIERMREVADQCTHK